MSMKFSFIGARKQLPAFMMSVAGITGCWAADWPQLQRDAARSGFQA